MDVFEGEAKLQKKKYKFVACASESEKVAEFKRMLASSCVKPRRTRAWRLSTWRMGPCTPGE